MYFPQNINESQFETIKECFSKIKEKEDEITFTMAIAVPDNEKQYMCFGDKLNIDSTLLIVGNKLTEKNKNKDMQQR